MLAAGVGVKKKYASFLLHGFVYKAVKFLSNASVVINRVKEMPSINPGIKEVLSLSDSHVVFGAAPLFL